MDDLTLDWVRKQQKLGEDIKHLEDLAGLDTSELPKWRDIDLAAWQSRYPPGSPQYILGEHEWQRRLADRQIAATHTANRRSIIGSILGTLFGVVLGWWLSSESRKPPLNQRSDIPVQTQRETNSQATQQQPVATPPQPAVQPTSAPVQKPVNPNP